MNVESVTVIIVADGRALVIQPTPAQISDIAWQCANGVREVPSDGPWIERELSGTATFIQPTPAQILDIAWQCANDLRERELSGMATFTLRIEGERTAVSGTWIDGRVVVPRIVQP